MPGTSVQISTRSALSSAPNSAADVSDPLRPSSAVPPSPWRAMKPWVSSIGAAEWEAKRSRHASSASRRQVAAIRRVHSAWLGNASASSHSRASNQPKSRP